MIQRATIRKLAIVGFLLIGAAIFEFFFGSLIGFDANYMQSAFEQDTLPAFIETTPGNAPFAALLILLLISPFLFGGSFQYLRVMIFVKDEFWRPALSILGMIDVILAILLMIVVMYSALYTDDPVERRNFTLLAVTVIYFDIFFVNLLNVSFGIYMYFSRQVPRYLALISLLAGVVGLLINLASPNHDLPAFRITAALPIMTVDVFLWALFLWVASGEKDGNTTFTTGV